MLTRVTSQGLRLLISAGLLAFLASVAGAQTALPPTENVDRQPRKKQIELSREARELGQEYLEILEELGDITADYSRYLGEINSPAVADQQRELKRLAIGLASGTYLQSIAQLSADIESVRNELAVSLEALHTDNRKAYKITRNLDRNLEALDCMLEAAIVEREVARQELAEKLDVYLSRLPEEEHFYLDAEKLRKLAVILHSNDTEFTISIPDYEFDFDFDFDELAELADLDELGNLYIAFDSLDFHGHELPSAGTVEPVAPAPPAPPAGVTGTRNFYYTGKSGATRVVREFADSISVPSDKLPIIIRNPIGAVRLHTGERGLLTARSETQISADQSDKARKLAQQVQFSITSDGKSINVDCIIPDLRDPQVRVDNGELDIVIPQGNPIICTTSFGVLTADHLRNNLAITSKHGEIQLSDIVGDVSIVNSMGSVDIEELKGSLTITNNRSPITIRDSKATMTLRNQFELISLEDSRGTVTIQNTGQVLISGHRGNAVIDNADGLVQVMHSTGDFEVRNSRQPVRVEYVDGAVTLDNNRAPITVSDISGYLKAANQFAPIQASHLSGPIELYNLKGTTFLSVGRDLTEGSTIQSTAGVIRVTLEPSLNLLVRASTTGGKIQGTWPMTIATTGQVKSTELILGKATSAMTITGENAMIILDKD